MSLLEKIKIRLHINNNNDDELLQGFILAAINYAESYQHIPTGTYKTENMSSNTEEAVMILVSRFYELRNSPDGMRVGRQTWDRVNTLLDSERYA